MSKGGYWRFYFRGARGGSNETRALSYSCKESTLVSSASLEDRAFLGSVWRPRLGAAAQCFGLRAMCTKGGMHCGWAFLGSVWRPRLGAAAQCFGLRAMCTKGGMHCGWAFLGSVWRPRLGAAAQCFGLRAMCTKGGFPCFPSAAAARVVLGFIWFPIVRARAPVAEGCEDICGLGFVLAWDKPTLLFLLCSL